MSRLGGVDILKHLFAISVIFQHTKSAIYSSETSAFHSGVTQWIDGAVMGFFLISGFFFSHERHRVTPQSLVTYVQSRATRLLAPYLIFSGLYAVALAGMGKVDFAEGLGRTLTLSGSSMQLYFLPLLFAMEVLAWLFLGLTRQWPLSILRKCLAGTLVCLSLAFPSTWSTGSEVALFPMYAIAFSVGLLLRNYGVGIQTVGTLMAAELLISLTDLRYLDLLIVTTLFACGHWASLKLQWLDRTLPGSGGVYLLHTSVLNFMIAHALNRIGIVEVANLISTVITTYIVSLTATLLFLSFSAKRRYLLLE